MFYGYVLSSEKSGRRYRAVAHPTFLVTGHPSLVTSLARSQDLARDAFPLTQSFRFAAARNLPPGRVRSGQRRNILLRDGRSKSRSRLLPDTSRKIPST